VGILFAYPVKRLDLVIILKVTNFTLGNHIRCSGDPVFPGLVTNGGHLLEIISVAHGEDRVFQNSADVHSLEFTQIKKKPDLALLLNGVFDYRKDIVVIAAGQDSGGLDGNQIIN